MSTDNGTNGDSLNIKNGRPVVENGIKIAHREFVSIKDMFGKSCRDCINDFQNLNLSREDCKYKKMDDGHRVRGRCEFCEKTRPLVVGLKLSGKLKSLRH